MNKEIEDDIEESQIRIRRFGVKLDYGMPDEPAFIVMVMERKDGKGIVSRRLIPEQAMEFAYDLGTKTQNDPKIAGISIEREDGEIETVALPPDGAMLLAEDMVQMAIRAMQLNYKKGFILKNEFKNKKPFIYKDLKSNKRL